MRIFGQFWLRWDVGVCTQSCFPGHSGLIVLREGLTLDDFYYYLVIYRAKISILLSKYAIILWCFVKQNKPLNSGSHLVLGSFRLDYSKRRAHLGRLLISNLSFSGLDTYSAKQVHNSLPHIY